MVSTGHSQEKYREATVKSYDAAVYSSPTTWTFKISTLPRGAKVQVFRKSGGRYLIRFRRGLSKKQGWMEGGDLSFGKVQREDSRIKVFQGVIHAERAMAYEKPSRKSRILREFSRDEQVEIVAQTKAWLKVLVHHDGPIKTYGFIRKGSAKLISKDAEMSSGHPAEGVEPEKKSPSRKVKGMGHDGEWKGHYVSLEGAPTFNLKRYGTTQYRIGVLYELMPGRRFSFGLPFRYAFGGGFNTIQFGVEVGYHFFSTESFLLGFKVSPILEYFFGSGRSFWALGVDAGPSLKYAFGNGFYLGWDPFVLEYALLRTKSIPSFIRWQTILRIGGRF